MELKLVSYKFETRMISMRLPFNGKHPEVVSLKQIQILFLLAILIYSPRSCNINLPDSQKAIKPFHKNRRCTSKVTLEAGLSTTHINTNYMINIKACIGFASLVPTSCCSRVQKFITLLFSIDSVHSVPFRFP